MNTQKIQKVKFEGLRILKWNYNASNIQRYVTQLLHKILPEYVLKVVVIVEIAKSEIMKYCCPQHENNYTRMT